MHTGSTHRGRRIANRSIYYHDPRPLTGSALEPPGLDTPPPSPLKGVGGGIEWGGSNKGLAHASWMTGRLQDQIHSW